MSVVFIYTNYDGKGFVYLFYVCLGRIEEKGVDLRIFAFHKIFL